MKKMKRESQAFAPIRIKPLKYNLLPKNDSDFDSLPDHLDCNPHNPLQQDRGLIKLSTPIVFGSLVRRKQKSTYIPPEQKPELPPNLNEYPTDAIEVPYETKAPELDEKTYDKNEEELLDKAQAAYNKTSNDPYHLFIQTPNGSWVRLEEWDNNLRAVGLENVFYSPNLSLQQQSALKKLLQHPDIVNYTLNQDRYFAEKINRKLKARREGIEQASSNIKKAFAPSRPTRASAAYAVGPSVPTRTPILGKRRTPTEILGQYSSNFAKTKYPNELMSRLADSHDEQQFTPMDLKSGEPPRGYQESSPFPLHAPYRPTKFGFVQQPTKVFPTKPPIFFFPSIHIHTETKRTKPYFEEDYE